jgi:small subunit ribosomal protein S21
MPDLALPLHPFFQPGFIYKSFYPGFHWKGIFIYLCAMLFIKVKEGESIDRAIRRYRKKLQRTGLLQELRSRQAFTKPSEEKRKVVKKAAYRQMMQNKMEG